MNRIEAAFAVAYLAAIVASGPLARRMVGGTEDFFLAGGRATFARGLGTLVLIFAGGGAVGVAGLGFSSGLAGAWYYLAYCLGFIVLAATFLGSLRALSRITIAEILCQRFGVLVARVSSLVTLAAWVFLLASLLAAGGRVLEASFGISYAQAVLLTTVVTGASASLGGMRAVVALSWLQAGLLVCGVAVLFVATLLWNGGWAPIFASLPDHFESPLPTAGLGTVFALLLVTAPTTLVGPDVYLNVWSLADARTARRTIWTLVVIVAACAVMLAVIGAAARSGIPHATPEQALPFMARRLLPPAVAGAVLVGLLGAPVSGAVPETIVCASILTRDLFQGWLSPSAAPRTALLVSRASVILVAATALVLAIDVQGVVELALHAYRIFVPAIVPQVLCALFVPWAKPRAVMASMLAGPTVTVVQALAFPQTLLSFGDPVAAGLIVAIAILTAGSLLTKREAQSAPLLTRADPTRPG